MLADADDQSGFDQLRGQAEALIGRDPGAADVPSSQILELIHELEVHQAELEIQNQELQRAQRELSDLHELYENLYEFAPCGYMTLNPKGMITNANLRAVELLGTNRESLLRSGLSQFVDPGWEDLYFRTLRECGEGGGKQSIEFPARRQSGSPRWARAEIDADCDGGGAVTRWRIVLTDVTARMELEEKLRQSQRLEAVGQLAGGVAHAFRNQLHVIMGFSSMLLEDHLVAEEGKEMVSQILAAGTRSTRLAGQLLAFSRRETLQPVNSDPGELIRDLHQPLQQMLGEDIRLVVNSSHGPARVFIDPVQFHHAMLVLCTNARDAMPSGGELRIEISTTDLDEDLVEGIEDVTPGEYVMVSVHDSGIGMDVTTRSKVFEPFFTTKGLGQGTGLGLSMVYGFARQSAGFVSCESVPGKGTTFRLYFHAKTSPSVRPGVEPGIETPPRGTGRVLLVEDEDSVRILVTKELEGAGYEVLRASGPDVALSWLSRSAESIDVLLTDVVMPGMNGLDLAAKAANLRPDLKVLYMSGYADEELSRRGLEGLQADVLQKPVSRVELLNRLAELLDRP